jgi:hypothetical protein
MFCRTSGTSKRASNSPRAPPGRWQWEQLASRYERTHCSNDASRSLTAASRSKRATASFPSGLRNIPRSVQVRNWLAAVPVWGDRKSPFNWRVFTPAADPTNSLLTPGVSRANV